MQPATTQLRRTALMTLLLFVALPGLAHAHCDSLDGPVINEARAALEQQDVTPLLKWVRPEDEATIRDAFSKTVAVRQLGPEAKKLADTYFFETLVRIHRAGEGAPFTGLKPAGSVEPVIAKADQTLMDGSADALADAVADHVARGIRERFARAAEAKTHAAESVEAGREFVERYVIYVHYVEGIAQAAEGGSHEGHADLADERSAPQRAP